MGDGQIRPVPECFSFGKFHPVYAVHSVNNLRQILWPNDLMNLTQYVDGDQCLY